MAGIPLIDSYRLPEPASLPDNRVRWTVHPRRSVLLIHDMQTFFVRPFAAPLRDQLVRNVAALRARCIELGVPVAYTAQPGRMTDSERGLLKDFWGPGMRTDPAERDVVAELTPASTDWRLTKWRYSAFHRSDLLERMRAAGRDQLVVCGVYAHVGVLATALDAMSNDIQPFLVADALGDFSPTHHQQTLEYAVRCCAMVVTTDQVLR